jgi:DNA repair exonuclease SbcCD nuclease subunit
MCYFRRKKGLWRGGVAVRRFLLVGDYHVVQPELDDCLALKKLVLSTIDNDTKIDGVIFTGDLFHSHNLLNTAVLEFWSTFFDDLVKKVGKIIAICGNHDMYSPTIMHPHALIAFKGKYEPMLKIIDKPTYLFDNVVAFPYYSDPVKFLEDCHSLKEQHPTATTIICHQTFDGAEYTEGFYVKDAANPVSVPFDNIISGHIHSGTKFGKVWYPGSPRWKTLSDANVNKFIYVVDFAEDGSYKVFNEISTSPACKKIVKFIDKEGEETIITDISSNSDVRVDIYGSSDYISKKMIEYKSKFNAKCRTFPNKVKTTRVSEADGIDSSFSRFSSSFKPPKGTDLNLLVETAGDRLAI